MQKLMMEDPSFHVRNDEETGQTLNLRDGELHSRSSSTGCFGNSRWRRTSGGPRSPTGKPSPVPRSRKGATSADGWRGQFGHVWITVEPGERERDSSSSTRSWGVHPEGIHPRRRKGDRGGRGRRCHRGYPVVDVKVTLIEGRTTKWTPRKWPFKIAGSMAFKAACQNAGPILLEPVMGGGGWSARGFHGRRHRGPELSDAEGSRRSRRAGTRRSSPPTSPSPTCSDTPPTCGRRPRAGRPTRCSSTLRGGAAVGERGSHRQGQGRVKKPPRREEETHTCPSRSLSAPSRT